MQTKAEAIAKLEQEQAEKRAQLERRFDVIDALGLGKEFNGYEPPSIFFHRLYGSRGSITFAQPFSDILAKGKKPDAALLRYLLQKFPAVELVKYRDACLSFRPDTNVTEEEEKRATECIRVFPVVVALETSITQTASFEWYAEVAGELWQFHVKFPLWRTDLGALHLEYDYHDRWHNSISRVRVCEFVPKHGAQRIRYASGSPTTPNPFVIYWDEDSGKAVDLPSLVKDEATR